CQGLIQIEVADGLARVWRFLGFLHRFLEFLFQNFGSMLLRLDRLPEDGFAAGVLFLHGAGGVLHVVKHARLHGGGMRNYGASFGIHFEKSAAAGTSDFESWGILRHFAHHTAKMALALSAGV